MGEDSDNAQEPAEGGNPAQYGPEIGHVYICPEAMPNAADGPEAWIQRVTLLCNEVDTMTRHVWNMLAANAPVLLNTEIGAHIGAIGLVVRSIEMVGTQMLEKFGMKPLDPLEDQKKLIRDQLADPATPAELRDFLLGILGHLNDLPDTPKPPPAEATEWPEEGFVIGGE